ncbi:uncharacterized protein BXZ73DRAFT_81182 [Epithele typhae]|uniref:uncharacterized protein n=1 Tax=Epithele typhae TaxID=378194 RepID=UPI00200764D9|nr:uncharacterized protein BXZ73DRAFT_81182 [Epithele typhae]KAH9916109.1 hypothetical protein BXZ73DRAFT_81182 [Epithele typhae]
MRLSSTPPVLDQSCHQVATPLPTTDEPDAGAHNIHRPGKDSAMFEGSLLGLEALSLEDIEPSVPQQAVTHIPPLPAPRSVVEVNVYRGGIVNIYARTGEDARGRRIDQGTPNTTRDYLFRGPTGTTMSPRVPAGSHPGSALASPLRRFEVQGQRHAAQGTHRTPILGGAGVKDELSSSFGSMPSSAGTLGSLPISSVTSPPVVSAAALPVVSTAALPVAAAVPPPVVSAAAAPVAFATPPPNHGHTNGGIDNYENIDAPDPQHRKKWYVVTAGRQVGIFKYWDDCWMNVRGVRNNCYKSYKTREEAETAYDRQKKAGRLTVVSS